MTDGDWREVRLGDVVSVNPEGIPSHWTGDERVRYVDIASVSSDRGIATEMITPIRFADAPGRARRRIRTKDVVVSTVRPNLRGFAQVPQELDGQVASTGFAVLRSAGKAAEVLPEFIWTLVRSERFVTDMIDRCTGSNYPAVRPNDIASHQFLLPPLSVQRRIVDVVGAFDAHIANLRAERSALADLRLSRARDHFLAQPRARLGDVVRVSQGRSLPLTKQGRASGSVPWYKLSDMVRHENVHGYNVAATSMTADQIVELGGLVFPTGTVCFARVGAAVKTEKKRLIDVPGSLDENHIALSPGTSEEGDYLLAAMELVSLTSLVREGAVPSLNQQVVRDLALPWSPDANIRSMESALLGEIRNLLRNLDSEIRAIKSVRARLLDALLSREVEIPKSYDALLAGVA